jgi:hypothetical protein
VSYIGGSLGCPSPFKILLNNAQPQNKVKFNLPNQDGGKEITFFNTKDSLKQTLLT